MRNVILKKRFPPQKFNQNPNMFIDMPNENRQRESALNLMYVFLSIFMKSASCLHFFSLLIYLRWAACELCMLPVSLFKWWNCGLFLVWMHFRSNVCYSANSAFAYCIVVYIFSLEEDSHNIPIIDKNYIVTFASLPLTRYFQR